MLIDLVRVNPILELLLQDYYYPPQSSFFRCTLFHCIIASFPIVLVNQKMFFEEGANCVLCSGSAFSTCMYTNHETVNPFLPQDIIHHNLFLDIGAPLCIIDKISAMILHHPRHNPHHLAWIVLCPDGAQQWLVSGRIPLCRRRHPGGKQIPQLTVRCKSTQSSHPGGSEWLAVG